MGIERVKVLSVSESVIESVSQIKGYRAAASQLKKRGYKINNFSLYKGPAHRIIGLHFA